MWAERREVLYQVNFSFMPITYDKAAIKLHL
jgi:hypothetical protein